MKEKRFRTPHTVKRLITRNPNKRLRTWVLPAVGWNMRRMMLEVASGGDWFTRTAVLKRFPEIGRANPLSYHFREAVKAGWLERQHIEGRPAVPHWTRQDRAEQGPYPGMHVMRQKARWAYRVTYAGLDKLERLRAGERDVLGRARSRHYAVLAEWMPARGQVPRSVILARLGTRWRGVLTWLRWNYGTPWPVAGRPGYWEWREATKGELFN
jgi:hypothetical protein